jgi:hypothetical protein
MAVIRGCQRRAGIRGNSASENLQTRPAGGIGSSFLFAELFVRKQYIRPFSALLSGGPQKDEAGHSVDIAIAFLAVRAA